MLWRTSVLIQKTRQVSFGLARNFLNLIIENRMQANTFPHITRLSHHNQHHSSHSSQLCFKKINEVFKYSPPHSKEMAKPEISFQASSRSKYRNETSCLNQLNEIFKHRKIPSDLPVFQEDQDASRNSRSKEKINEDIKHSIIFIQNLKKKKKQFQKLRGRHQELAPNQTLVVNDSEKQSVLEAIGLELPGLQQKRKPHVRYVTEPLVPEIQKKPSSYDIRQLGGLYSYLQRDFLDRKGQALTETKLLNYAKNPKDKNFQRILLEKSREFIKASIENNDREVGKIISMLNEQSKKIISRGTNFNIIEISEKKKIYQKDYFIRKNVPYFSFLSLKENEKQSVLKSMRRKKSIS